MSRSTWTLWFWLQAIGLNCGDITRCQTAAPRRTSYLRIVFRPFNRVSIIYVFDIQLNVLYNGDQISLISYFAFSLDFHPRCSAQVFVTDNSTTKHHDTLHQWRFHCWCTPASLFYGSSMQDQMQDKRPILTGSSGCNSNDVGRNLHNCAV